MKALRAARHAPRNSECPYFSLPGRVNRQQPIGTEDWQAAIATAFGLNRRSDGEGGLEGLRKVACPPFFFSHQISPSDLEQTGEKKQGDRLCDEHRCLPWTDGAADALK